MRNWRTPSSRADAHRSDGGLGRDAAGAFLSPPPTPREMADYTARPGCARKLASHGSHRRQPRSQHRPRVSTLDVVIAGAGPAGLSAALILGRARRRVLLCDTGSPRSWASKAMHAYLSRDGMSPHE